jgi:hypothetical protein
MTLGPEFSPLVQRYARHMQKAKDIYEIGALLIAYGMDRDEEQRKRCQPDEPNCEVTGCNGGEG